MAVSQYNPSLYRQHQFYQSIHTHVTLCCCACQSKTLELVLRKMEIALQSWYTAYLLTKEFHVQFITKQNNFSLTCWLVVFRFNATLTAKVISWPSVTHTCFLAFSHQYEHKFLSKATNYFSHILQLRLEVKISRKEILPQPGFKLTITRSQVRHAHHWAIRARLCYIGSICWKQNEISSLIGLKTLWETEKMLVTSIFFFSHNVSKMCDEELTSLSIGVQENIVAMSFGLIILGSAS